MPATLTYSPLFPQNTAEFLHPYPCRHVRYAATHPVQPLKGLPGTRATDVSYRASVPAGHAGRGVALSYRALAPGGAGIWHRTCAGTSGGVVIMHSHLSSAGSPPPRLRSLAAHVIPRDAQRRAEPPRTRTAFCAFRVTPTLSPQAKRISVVSVISV